MERQFAFTGRQTGARC